MREAASDDGTPREASPFWDEVARLFAEEEVRRATTRRPLSALTWPIEGAPTERERLRALAALAASDEVEANALALANGWERRLERALHAFRRPTRLRHPLVLDYLGERTSFNVTELERFSDCSSAWFVERLLDPHTIDAEADAKLRGSVAHSALNKFFSGIPKELGVERLDESTLDRALPFLRRCLDTAVNGVRMEMTELQRQELDQTLWRDLEALVRAEAVSELELVPRRFEVSFGRERSTFGGLDLGDGLSLSGKIDRVDVETFGARGIVHDYKSGRSAHSAAQIQQEQRLQIPLYMLVLRDLVGVEPLGGLYRPLAGERKPRGLLRSSAKEELPGYARNDYLDEDEFWSRLETARADARALAQRIRAGDVDHDPRGGSCPRGATSGASAGWRGRERRAAGGGRRDRASSSSRRVPGTGKTKVLVERFVRAVCDDGLDVSSVLVITYTKRAAGELRSRIRARLLELGRVDLARELDGAWISTIHGFCNRLLKTYPLAAGLDPRFRELDEAQGSVLRGEAFEAALAEFCSDGDPERLRLLATYRASGLRRMLTGVYGTLRSAGRELVLELGERPNLDDALERLERRGAVSRRGRSRDGCAARRGRAGARARRERSRSGCSTSAA